MKKNMMNGYLAVLFIATIGLVLFTSQTEQLEDWKSMLFWFILVVISESFLIVTPSGEATSVAGAVYIYIGIMSNPLIVILIGIVGCALRFPEVNGKREHLFNTKSRILIFNSLNIALSYGLSAWVFKIYYDAFSITPADFDIIPLIPLTLIAVIIAEVVNFLTISTMLKIANGIKYQVVLKAILGTFASTIGISLLGLFLAFADDEFQEVTVLLFFIPLLLARYSFKLYFDSQRMALETIHALNEALHAKDAYTGGHTGRVEKYSVDLAEAYGLSPTNVDLIRTAALLHDIGKIGIPDNILNKPGKLTLEEFQLIQEHSTIGAKILGNVDSLKKVAQIIVQHHERYDGTGYPNQLQGHQISQEASILMISDSFDAMTTNRPYRLALSKEEAISELVKYSGTQFHPELTACFVEHVLNIKTDAYINKDAFQHDQSLEVEEVLDNNNMITE